MIMGKEQCKYNVTKTCVLRIGMHCQCNGCVKKIIDAVQEISLSEGVESAYLVVEKAEVQVVGTTDPEKLCGLLHELTKKDVKIETQRTLSQGSPAASQCNKKGFGQAPSCPSDHRPPETPGAARRQDSSGALLLPETWSSSSSSSHGLPSERCAYRWSATCPGTLGAWTESDTTVTLAVYEL